MNSNSDTIERYFQSLDVTNKSSDEENSIQVAVNENEESNVTGTSKTLDNAPTKKTRVKLSMSLRAKLSRASKAKAYQLLKDINKPAKKNIKKVKKRPRKIMNNKKKSHFKIIKKRMFSQSTLSAPSLCDCPRCGFVFRK